MRVGQSPDMRWAIAQASLAAQFGRILPGLFDARCALRYLPRSMARSAISRLLVLLAATGHFACAGEPRVLPPRTPPPQDVPNVEIPRAEVPERHGRMVLDTTDGPMRVAARHDPRFVPPGGAPERTRSGELCVTPCVVDLPVGRYRLYFSGEGREGALGDTDDVEVREGVHVYRLAPGLYRTPSPVDTVAPGALVVLSGVAATLGTLMLLGEGNQAAGGVLLGAGVAGIIGGSIWAYDASRAVTQDGSSTLFSLRP